MNKAIEQLAERTSLSNANAQDVEEFAHLLIEECLKVITQNLNCSTPYDQKLTDNTNIVMRNWLSEEFGIPRSDSMIQKYLARLGDIDMITESDVTRNVYIVSKNAAITCDSSAFALGKCFRVLSMVYDEGSDSLILEGARKDEVYKTNNIKPLMSDISHAQIVNIKDIL